MGGSTLEAAEALAGAPPTLPIEPLAGLAELVDANLVQARPATDPGSASRVGMLQPVRAYAQELLESTGERDAFARWHREWYLAVAERAVGAIDGHEQVRWLDTLEADLDNLRAALSWSMERPAEAEDGARLAAALWRFWQMRGHFSEGLGWLERALDAEGIVCTEVRARAMHASGYLAYVLGDYARAERRLQESALVFKQVGDLSRYARSLRDLSIIYLLRGNLEEARALLNESLAHWRALGEISGIGFAMQSLGNVASAEDNRVLAYDCWTEALTIWRTVGNSALQAGVLNNLGALAFRRGNLQDAMSLHEESLTLRRMLRDNRGIAESLENLSAVVSKLGDQSRAWQLLIEGLQLYRNVGDMLGCIRSVEQLAVIAAAAGKRWQALRHLSVAAAAREQHQMPLPHADRPWYEALIASSQAELGEAVARAAWDTGRAMPLEQVVSELVTGTIQLLN